MQTIKHYESFSPDERLNLTLAAIAREDIEEMQSLARTCPMMIYRSPDRRYAKRLQAVGVIALHFSNLIANCFNKIILLNVISIMDDVAPILSQKIFNSNENTNSALNILLSNIASLRAIYNGLIDFCNEIGINHEDILIMEKINEKHPYMQGFFSLTAEENKVHRQDIKNTFLTYWKAYD
jgi:hypothetical protein